MSGERLSFKVSQSVIIAWKYLLLIAGGGIPQNNLTRIFAPFFTTREVGKGTESGLSVSFGIIRDMGGNLRAGSSGEGAKFTITLPTVRKSAESRWQLTYLWIK